MSDCNLHAEQIKQNTKQLNKIEMKVENLEREFSDNKTMQIQTQTMVTVLVEEMRTVVRKLDKMADRLAENDKKTDASYAFVNKTVSITWDTIKKAIGYLITAIITAILVGLGIDR